MMAHKVPVIFATDSGEIQEKNCISPPAQLRNGDLTAMERERENMPSHVYILFTPIVGEFASDMCFIDLVLLHNQFSAAASCKSVNVVMDIVLASVLSIFSPRNFRSCLLSDQGGRPTISRKKLYKTMQSIVT